MVLACVHIQLHYKRCQLSCGPPASSRRIKVHISMRINKKACQNPSVKDMVTILNKDMFGLKNTRINKFIKLRMIGRENSLGHSTKY
ncbi:hypothetical protein CapIbe_003571 [Capra ibex]